MRVALGQHESVRGDVAANLARMDKTVTESGADLVVFPELFLTGYNARDGHMRLAEALDGPSVAAVKGMAKASGATVVFGMPERDPMRRGVIYNSAVLVRPDGTADAYRKYSLPNFGPFEEKVFFAPGKRAVVAEGRHARIGLMICYDMFFPELAKLETLLGAQLLANVSAAPTTSRPFFRRVMPGRAVENAVFLAYTNLVGVHGSLVFGGGSVLLGPRGEELGKGRDLEEDIVTAEVDLADLDVARRFRPTVRDTRPELLQEIVSVLTTGKVKGG